MKKPKKGWVSNRGRLNLTRARKVAKIVTSYRMGCIENDNEDGWRAFLNPPGHPDVRAILGRASSTSIRILHTRTQTRQSRLGGFGHAWSLFPPER